VGQGPDEADLQLPLSIVQADLADDLRHGAALDVGDARLVFPPERRRGELAVSVGEGQRSESATGGVAVLDLHDEERVLHAITNGQLLQIEECGQV
jgi:hypothetical protein